LARESAELAWEAETETKHEEVKLETKVSWLRRGDEAYNGLEALYAVRISRGTEPWKHSRARTSSACTSVSGPWCSTCGGDGGGDNMRALAGRSVTPRIPPAAPPLFPAAFASAGSGGAQRCPQVSASATVRLQRPSSPSPRFKFSARWAGRL
jgi:hypothetical protein